MIRVACTALVLTLVLAATAAASPARVSSPAASRNAPPQSVLTTLATLGGCPKLAGLGSSLLSALSGAGGNVRQEVAAIKRAAAKAPAPVRPDFLTIANALGQAVTALKGVDLSTASATAITQVMGKLQSPAVTKATAHITTWAAKNCHA
jgi:hypothetical protein